MNIKELYLKTADHIEQHPEEYDFDKYIVPTCGSPGCILALMGMLSGIKPLTRINTVAKTLLSLQSCGTFYRQMFSIRSGWTSHASIAVSNLRALAKQMTETDEEQAMSFPELMESLKTQKVIALVSVK